MGGLKAKAHVKTAYHLGWIGDQLPHLKPNYIGGVDVELSLQSGSATGVALFTCGSARPAGHSSRKPSMVSKRRN